MFYFEGSSCSGSGYDVTEPEKENRQLKETLQTLDFYSERRRTKGTVLHSPSYITSCLQYHIFTLHFNMQPCYSIVANASSGLAC